MSQSPGKFRCIIRPGVFARGHARRAHDLIVMQACHEPGLAALRKMVAIQRPRQRRDELMSAVQTRAQCIAEDSRQL